jgi:hypothetical protein
MDYLVRFSPYCGHDANWILDAYARTIQPSKLHEEIDRFLLPTVFPFLCEMSCTGNAQIGARRMHDNQIPIYHDMPFTVLRPEHRIPVNEE